MTLLLTCVGENTRSWFTKVENLVISVRSLGGRFGEVPMVVNFVDEVADDFARPLAELGAEVRVVERVAGNGLANKLRALDLCETDDFETLVVLDCDVVVVDDLSDAVPEREIGAKPADYARLSSRDWSRLYELVGAERPSETLAATSTGDPMPPYFNSGVVTIPRPLGVELREQWKYCYELLQARFEEDPE